MSCNKGASQNATATLEKKESKESVEKKTDNVKPACGCSGHK
jgi:hypothetical protein